jgi:hypothetical protein
MYPSHQMSETLREMNELFPCIEPYDAGFLKVSSVHSIYYEQSGNEKGNPVVYLHGGNYFTKHQTIRTWRWNISR